MSYSFTNPTTAASVIPYYDLEAFRAIAESCHEGQDACNSYVISLIKQMFGDASIQAAPANAQRGFKKRKITPTEDQHLYKLEFLLRNQKLLLLLNPYLHNKGRLSGLQIVTALSIIQEATIKITRLAKQPSMNSLARATSLSALNLFDHFNQVMIATSNLFSKQSLRHRCLLEACILANLPSVRFILGLGPIREDIITSSLNYTISYIKPNDDISFATRMKIISLLTPFVEHPGVISDSYLTACDKYRGYDAALVLMERHNIPIFYIKEIIIQAKFDEDKLKDAVFITEYLIFCEKHHLLDFQREGMDAISFFLLAALKGNHFETAEFVVNKFDFRSCNLPTRDKALLAAAEKDRPEILQAMVQPLFPFEKAELSTLIALKITILRDNIESFKILWESIKEAQISPELKAILIQTAQDEGRTEMLQYLRS